MVPTAVKSRSKRDLAPPPQRAFQVSHRVQRRARAASVGPSLPPPPRLHRRVAGSNYEAEEFSSEQQAGNRLLRQKLLHLQVRSFGIAGMPDVTLATAIKSGDHVRGESICHRDARRCRGRSLAGITTMTAQQGSQGQDKTTARAAALSSAFHSFLFSWRVIRQQMLLG